MVNDTKGYSGAPKGTEADSATLDDVRRVEWLSPWEAVEYSGIGRTRLSGYLTSGAIPSAKVGRTRHIRRRDLDAFLEARMQLTGRE